MFVDLAAYRMRVSERITPFQTAEGGDRTFFRNSGEATHEGVEGALTILFSEEVRFTSSVQSNRFRFRNGNRIPGLAEFVATSSLQIRSNGFTVAAELISVGDQYANEVNTLRNAARTTGDLSIAKAFDVEEGQFVVSVRVQNLTDARYNGSVVVNPFNARAFEPAPGRMGVVTVGYRF
jgi:iron complex outermembrane receptor protein